MKQLFVCFLYAMPLSGMAQEPTPPIQNYVIKGHLDHVKGATTAYLFYREHGFRKDSAKVKDHQFTFSGSVGAPQKAFIVLAHNGDNANSRPSMDQVAVYLENGTIEVKTADSLKYAKVGGTQLNRDQQDYINALGNIRDLQTNIAKKISEENDRDKVETLTAEYKQLDVLLQNSLANFITTHPNSQVALNCLRSNFIPTDNVELATTLYNALTDSIKKVAAAAAYKEAIDNTFKIKTGNIAPDFAVNDMKGKERHLSDFRGKYVLLDFWASWCGPCRKESPNLVESYDKFKAKNFEILSFSLDEDSDDWKAAVEKDKYTWTNVRQAGNVPDAVSKLYSITGIPANFLLDPTGKIIATDLRGKELEKTLSEIIK
jgi:peroxiredoxin